MEKKIVLTMLPSKDINIAVNDKVMLTVSKNNRTIKADDIYRLLDYKIDDTYTIETVNEDILDAPVLKFFANLLQDIINRICPKNNSEDVTVDELPF